MDELAPGLWTWTDDHPAWTPQEGGPDGWEREVRSYALESGDSLVLLDPLVAAPEVERLAAGRPVAVILTCRWHRRSSAELVERLGATVHSPASDVDELGVPALPYGPARPFPAESRPGSAATRTRRRSGSNRSARS